MARRRKFTFGKKKTGPGHNQSNDTARSDKKRMLDTRRDKDFIFDLRDLVAELENQDTANSLEGNITVKATTQSINAADEYVDRMLKEKRITEKEAEKIKRLLGKYSKWR